MTAPPRLPNPLTPESLQGLMRERPYRDPSHPRSKIYRRRGDYNLTKAAHWLAAGSEDTELSVNMEPEMDHGTMEV